MLIVLVMPVTCHYVLTSTFDDEFKLGILYLAVLLFQGFGIAGMLAGLVERDKGQNISEPHPPRD